MASHNQSYRAGEAKGRTEEKTKQTLESMKEQTGAAKDKTYETAQAAKDKTYEKADEARDNAEIGREKTGGFFQQTGEQMKNAAQGAADAVKHTFGLGDDNTSQDQKVHVHDTTRRT